MHHCTFPVFRRRVERSFSMIFFFFEEGRYRLARRQISVETAPRSPKLSFDSISERAHCERAICRKAFV